MLEFLLVLCLRLGRTSVGMGAQVYGRWAQVRRFVAPCVQSVKSAQVTIGLAQVDSLLVVALSVWPCVQNSIGLVSDQWWR